MLLRSLPQWTLNYKVIVTASNVGDALQRAHNVYVKHQGLKIYSLHTYCTLLSIGAYTVCDFKGRVTLPVAKYIRSEKISIGVRKSTYLTMGLLDFAFVFLVFFSRLDSNGTGRWHLSALEDFYASTQTSDWRGDNCLWRTYWRRSSSFFFVTRRLMNWKAYQMTKLHLGGKSTSESFLSLCLLALLSWNFLSNQAKLMTISSSISNSSLRLLSFSLWPNSIYSLLSGSSNLSE